MLWKPFCSLYGAFGTRLFDFKGAKEILGEAASVTLSRLSNEGLLLTGCSSEDGRMKAYRLLDPRDAAHAEATLAKIPKGFNAPLSIPLCGLPYRFKGATAARIYHGEEVSSFFEMEVLRRDIGKWVRFLVALSAQVSVGGFRAPPRARRMIFDLDPRDKIGPRIRFKGVYLPPPEELLIDLLERGTKTGYVEARRLSSATKMDLERIARREGISFKCHESFG